MESVHGSLPTTAYMASTLLLQAAHERATPQTETASARSPHPRGWGLSTAKGHAASSTPSPRRSHPSAQLSSGFRGGRLRKSPLRYVQSPDGDTRLVVTCPNACVQAKPYHRPAASSAEPLPSQRRPSAHQTRRRPRGAEVPSVAELCRGILRGWQQTMPTKATPTLHTAHEATITVRTYSALLYLLTTHAQQSMVPALACYGRGGTLGSW